jgi:hypothetical protein
MQQNTDTHRSWQHYDDCMNPLPGDQILGRRFTHAVLDELSEWCRHNEQMIEWPKDYGPLDLDDRIATLDGDLFKAADDLRYLANADVYEMTVMAKTARDDWHGGESGCQCCPVGA